MGVDTPATAEGDLGRTPFAHLLVYAVDRRLTGALFLSEPKDQVAGEEPAFVEHVVRLARGVPVKVRPGDGYSLLGEMLIGAGALDEKTLSDALGTKGLLGDVLMLAGRVDRDVLENTAELQFMRRMVRLFALPPGTTFRYCDGHTELLDYGGEPASMDPLALLWAGLSTHGESTAMLDDALGRIGDMPLKLHAAATVSRLELGERERRVIAHLEEAPEPLAVLEVRQLLPHETLRRLVYALIITRQLDIPGTAPPVGAGDMVRGTAHVARMALKSTMHRAGAAVPDAPGEGERRPPSGPARKRKRPPAKNRPTPVEPPPIEPPTQDDGRSTLRSAEGQESEPGPRPSVTVEEAPPPLSKMAPAALFELARTRLAERNVDEAAEAAALAVQGAPDNADYLALSAGIRAQRGGADLKTIAVELDEVLGASPNHVEARYHRGVVRKRLGDNVGAVRDLRRVLELSPAHVEAARVLEGLEGPRPKERAGLLSWLFKR